MLDTIFAGIFTGSSSGSFCAADFFACLATALLIGLLMALAYVYKSKYSKSFVVTLALLPAIVCVVIMMVNGNIGVGVAVAGAFSLVRFRSVPGTAREIGAIFLAMAAGLTAGMGYLAYAVVLAVILSLLGLACNTIQFGGWRPGTADKTLRITIPEDLDYSGVFDDLLAAYTLRHEVVQVKTTNMGSLFRLTYNLTMRNERQEKEFIDKLRCRNGNLEISISRQETNANEL